MKSDPPPFSGDTTEFFVPNATPEGGKITVNFELLVLVLAKIESLAEVAAGTSATSEIGGHTTVVS